MDICTWCHLIFQFVLNEGKKMSNKGILIMFYPSNKQLMPQPGRMMRMVIVQMRANWRVFSLSCVRTYVYVWVCVSLGVRDCACVCACACACVCCACLRVCMCLRVRALKCVCVCVMWFLHVNSVLALGSHPRFLMLTMEGSETVFNQA